MSLLTKEQLKEILLIIEEEVNVEWPCSMLEMLHKWNEKQPPQTAREMYQRGYAAAERALKREPLSIDWAEAPENTAIAKVALFWVTEDNLMLGRKDLVSIEKPVNGADND
jgi:predicted chitinase